MDGTGGTTLGVVASDGHGGIDHDENDDDEDDDAQRTKKGATETNGGCCGIMCTTPNDACCLKCECMSSPREHDLLMATMEGLTHHIMDKHRPPKTNTASSSWNEGLSWLKDRSWEGNSHIGNRPVQATYYYDWTRSVLLPDDAHDENGDTTTTPGRRICEIGMNGGHSALIFLAATSRYDTSMEEDDVTTGMRDDVDSRSTELIMFDLYDFAYSNTAKRYIETLYPGRFEIHVGNSRITLPGWISGLTTEDDKCDIFSIDGDHTYEGALSDIRNAAKATRGGGRVILDDMTPGGETRRAFDDAVSEEIIGDPRCVENVSVRVGYEDRYSVSNSRSLMMSWCTATVL